MTTTFRITHPFHPLFEREFELVCIQSIFGRRRVYFHQDGERLWTVPLAWTDLAPPDCFREMAQGRSLFRPDDLLRLASLIEGLRGRPEGEAGVLGEPHA